jgi:polyhydroxyalkanoate synthesis regulator phasin
MTSDNFTQLLQKSFRITLGATAALVETLQDPYKRTENFSQLRTELEQLTTEWAAKGEITEQEARNFVQQLWDQLGNKQSSPTADSSVEPSVRTPVENVAPPDVQLELQELTAQIAAMRAELEKLQNPDSDTP